MNRALLIGINKYASLSVPNLSGCLNDVKLIKSFLNSSKAPKFEIKELTDEMATRENIISHICDFLGEVGKGEVALLFFSGHGALQKSPKKLAAVQRSDRHENIVCHDSLYKGGQFLADKELKFLLSRIEEKKGSDIVAIFDCCHSGSGLRNLVGGELTIKRIKALEEPREESTFIEGALDKQEKNPPYRFIAACSPREFAYEQTFSMPDGGTSRNGLLTKSLVDILSKHSPGAYDYVNLMDAIRSRIAWHLDSEYKQSPRLEVTGNLSGKVGFLMHDHFTNSNRYLLSWSSDRKKWVVNIGLLHGLVPDSVARFQINLKQGTEKLDLLGVVKTASIGLFESTIEFPEDFPVSVLLKGEQIYEAFILSAELFRLDVCDKDTTINPEKNLPSMVPPDGTTAKEHLGALLRNQLVTKEGFTAQINLTTDSKGTIYSIQQAAGGFQIVYSETGAPIHDLLIPDKDGRGLPTVQYLCEMLMHLGRYERLMSLSSSIEDGGWRSRELTLEVHEYIKSQGVESEFVHQTPFITIDVPPGPSDKGRGPGIVPFRVFGESFSESTLYIRWLYFGLNKEVFEEREEPLSQNNRRRLEGDTNLHHRFLMVDGRLNDLDIYMLIGSQMEIPHTDLDLAKGIDKRVKAIYARMNQNRGTATRSGIEAKGVGSASIHDHEKDWFTKTIIIKTLKTLGKFGESDLQVLDGNLQLRAHTGFSGEVSLANLSKHLLLSDSDAFMKDYAAQKRLEVLDFTGKGDRQIELHHIQGKQTVSESDPFQIVYSGQFPTGGTATAYTLPESLFLLDSLNQPMTDEDGALVLPSLVKLGEWEPQPDGTYLLSITSIPPNPEDYRRDKGRSLKIVTFVAHE